MREPGWGFIGPVGSLGPVILTDSEPEQTPARYSVRKSVTGRVFSQRTARRPRRVWSVSADDVAPRDHAWLWQLANSEGPVGAVVWYSATSVVSNILTPAVAAMGADQLVGSRMAGGSVVVPSVSPSSQPAPGWDGRVLDTITQASTSIISIGGDVPVPDGSDVTASVHVTAQAGVRPQFVVREYDPQGVMVREHRAQGTLDAALERVHLTIRTDPRTVLVRMGTIGALRTAAPAVTLTDHLTPWTPGMGCLSAVVDYNEWSPSHGRYYAGSTERVGSASFTITEVG